MTIQITNPLSKSQTYGWFVTNPKSAIDHHHCGPRRVNRGGPRLATTPWPLTRSKPTHNHTGDLKPPTAIHGDLNPPMASHNHHQPTAIWIPHQSEAYKSILREREEKLSLWEEERRERDGSTSGFAGGGNGVGFFSFFYCGWWLWVDVGVVGGCGCECGGFFLLWFLFFIFVSGSCGMGGGLLVGGW